MTKKQIIIQVLLLGIVLYFFIYKSPFASSRHQTNIPGTQDTTYRETGSYNAFQRKEGKWVGYYASGDTAYIGFYRNGLKDSLWSYFLPTGQLEKTENYDSNGRNKLIVYNKNGSIYDEVEYKGNKKNGKHIHYYSNQSINYSQQYADDKMHGEFVLYFQNGRIKQKGNFRLGKSTGEWFLYDENGHLLTKTIYNDSLKNYREIKFRPNGDTISSRVIENH